MSKRKLMGARRPGKTIGRHGTRAGALLVSLGLTASLAASPTIPHRSAVYPKVSHVYPKVSHAGKPLGKGSWQEVGKASWYGPRFDGHKTATGEKYDMHALTCAHRTLPLGTWVRVTNLLNHKFTFLRVNDRGPMAHAFIVDLSYGAAQKLGITGLGKVKIEALSPARPELAEQMIAQMHLPNDPMVLDAARSDRTLPLVVEAER